MGNNSSQIKSLKDLNWPWFWNEEIGKNADNYNHNESPWQIFSCLECIGIEQMYNKFKYDSSEKFQYVQLG